MNYTFDKLYKLYIDSASVADFINKLVEVLNKPRLDRDKEKGD